MQSIIYEIIFHKKDIDTAINKIIMYIIIIIT